LKNSIADKPNAIATIKNVVAHNTNAIAKEYSLISIIIKTKEPTQQPAGILELTYVFRNRSIYFENRKSAKEEIHLMKKGKQTKQKTQSSTRTGK